MSPEEFDEIIIASNKFYGRRNRQNKVIEECGELIQGIAKFQAINPQPNTKEDIDMIDHICQEIADVEIVLASYKKYLPTNVLEKFKDQKITRLKLRLSENIISSK